MNSLSIENLSRVVQSGDELLQQQGSRTRAESLPQKPSTIEGAGSAQAPSEAGGASFTDLLKSAVNKVNDYQAEADLAVKELVAGRNKNIHETMLTLERADLSLKLMTQVRNKILEAYREIMRMQV